MSAGSYTPQGELSFRTASRLHAEGLAVIDKAGATLRISLAEIHHVDSAGLAVLIDWLRESEQRGCRLEFADLPPALLRLAAISELDTVLTQS
jgi:phospholipid transport system transporter-binding protein